MYALLIESVAAKSGKNDKVNELAKHFADPTHGPGLSKICRLAYDPFITFGIDDTKFLEAHPLASGAILGSEVLEHRHIADLEDLFERLAKRQLSGKNAQLEVLSFCIKNKFNADQFNLVAQILKKDLRFGMAVALVNEALVAAGLPRINVFAMMLAHKFEDKKFVEGKAYLCQPKLDGVRACVSVSVPLDVNGVGNARAWSRNGKQIVIPESLADELVDFCTVLSKQFGPYPHAQGIDFWLDGELTTEKNFNDAVSKVRKLDASTKDDLVFTVFDIFDTRQTWDAYKRFEYLATTTTEGWSADRKVKIIENHVITSKAQAVALYDQWRSQGLEGAIVKDASMFYELKRSWGWMKLKAEETIDLKVTGKFEGEGKYRGKLGGLIVDNNGVSVRVGSGFSDAQREEIWALDDEHLIDRVIEIEYHETTPDGSLRHPRFKQFRNDKD